MLYATPGIVPRTSSFRSGDCRSTSQITTLVLSHSGPEMPSPAAMPLGAGPLYTNALMGQAPSTAARENARKASSTILRQDTIHIEESENVSRPESWSIHFACTDQAPFSPREGNGMITQSSILHLPPANPSHDLAFFLRTTGPTQPHRRPSKLNQSQDASSGKHGNSRNALRFLRIRQKRWHTPIVAAHERSVIIVVYTSNAC